MNSNRLAGLSASQQIDELRRAWSAGEVTAHQVKTMSDRFGLALPEDLRAVCTHAIAKEVLKPQQFRLTDGGVRASSTAQKAGIPTGTPASDATLSKFRERLDNAFVGQDAAKATMTKIMRERHATIPDLVFVKGDIGTGKTQFVRSIAEVVNGNPDAYVTIDAATVRSPTDLFKYLGCPPGFVGHGTSETIVDRLAKQTGKPILLIEGIGYSSPEVQDTLAKQVAEWRSPSTDHALSDYEGKKASLKGGMVAVFGTDQEVTAFRERVAAHAASPKLSTSIADRIRPAKIIPFKAIVGS